jgi:D-alanyl-D-alanine carboxypeptidase/D-alanyl-D-alanine-endopeptidase (penicillin-binding protein 4)
MPLRKKRSALVLPVVILLAVLVATPQAVGSPARGLTAATAAGSNVDHRSKVDVLMQRRLGDVRLGSKVSMIVVDAATGAVISAQQPNRPMQPASNMKLVTAVTALATLGPTKLFVTRVLAGRTPADLILQGAGDPLLSAGDLRDLAKRTARTLAPHSRVRIHVDGDLFPAPAPAPGWVAAYIGSSVGFVQALAVHGDRSRRPSRNAGELFAADLRRLGVKAAVAANQGAAPDATEVAKTHGHSVEAAISVMLSNSDSSIAEVLFRQVAIAQGRPATWQGSQRAAKEVLGTLGIDTTRMVLADGSGLSRKDRISPQFLVNVLRVARVTQAQRFASMFDSNALPIAGRTGTLNTSFGRYSTSPSKCARGRVQAKTGTILGTIALSGVAITKHSGERLFSVIVNDRPLRFSALDTRRAVDNLAATVEGCWK